MSEPTTPINLAYEQRAFSRRNRFLAWMYRQRLRCALLLTVVAAVLVVLYRGVFYEVRIIHDPVTYTAIKQSHMGVGGIIVWRRNEPAPFLYADIAQPDDPPVKGVLDNYFTHNRLAWQRVPRTPWVLQLNGKRYADGMWITCASGLRQPVDARVQAFESVRKRLPDASQKQRYAMFRHLMESLRAYDGTIEYNALNDWPTLINEAAIASTATQPADASRDRAAP